MAELVVEFSALQVEIEGEASRWGAGVVVTDVATARAVHESGKALEAAGEAEAAYAALLRALGVIEPLNPTDVELRCDLPMLVEDLTGGGSPDAAVEAQFEQVMMRLLQLGLWRIRHTKAAELRRARELAEAAAGGTATAPDEPVASQPQSAAGQPATVRWTVAFTEEAGPRCPANCRAGQRFGFGPDTPAGFCVHAMAAVAEDGPLTWHAPEQQRMFTVCPHCDVPMDIERVD